MQPGECATRVSMLPKVGCIHDTCPTTVPRCPGIAVVRSGVAMRPITLIPCHRSLPCMFLTHQHWHACFLQRHSKCSTRSDNADNPAARPCPRHWQCSVACPRGNRTWNCCSPAPEKTCKLCQVLYAASHNYYLHPMCSVTFTPCAV